MARTSKARGYGYYRPVTCAPTAEDYERIIYLRETAKLTYAEISRQFGQTGVWSFRMYSKARLLARKAGNVLSDPVRRLPK